MDAPIKVASDDFEPLTKEEINAFFDDIDRDSNGYVTFDELEAKLHDVHKEIAPEPRKHNLHHPERRDLEKNDAHAEDGLQAFLRSLMPACEARLSREEFTARVEKWRVPSQKQQGGDQQDLTKMGWRRHVRAYMAVQGPTVSFMAFVVAWQLAFGLWQMIIYIKNPRARAALGWGVILAKAAAGVLYPTLFFMLLSMSRWFSTWLRHSYYISKVVNWDLSQAFHIKMSVCGLFFASLHAIGHLTGSFRLGSQASRQDAVAEILGPDAVPRPYVAYVRSLPGWTGIVALGLFWTISLLSMPYVRKNLSYEVFQLGHLLMFPMIGLSCAHGTAKLLQYPMLGFFLAFPTALIVYERISRLVRGLMSVPARAEVLDSDTVLITCKHPQGKDWPYSAGQYILLQVPIISHFQWHPFTISSCRGNTLTLHIKFDGDWTNQLHDLPSDQDIRVGLDGPFGSPAQRFFTYKYSIIVGGGIGVTPFSAILTDLEESYGERKDPWASRRGSRSVSRGRQSRRSSVHPSDEDELSLEKLDRRRSPERRVDFHWTVCDKNNLLWFSDLLNRAIDGARPLATQAQLSLNINTHVTQKRKNISTHCFRYLLDSYRTQAAPCSALTGLKQPSHFGRPDFAAILNKHFDELVESGVKDEKVGVFYCGAPVVGKILADACHNLTAKGREMGLRIRYDFLMEVFG